MSITKDMLLNWYSWMRKITIPFDIENWLWESNFGNFWHLSNWSDSQNSIISLEYVDSLVKLFVILYPPLEKLHNPYWHSWPNLLLLPRDCLIVQKMVGISPNVPIRSGGSGFWVMKFHNSKCVCTEYEAAV